MMELWLIKYKLLHLRYTWRSKLKRMIFCRLNQHELTGGKQEFINSKGKSISTEYIRCKNCNVHYFPSKKHKDNYLRLQNREKDVNTRIIKMLADMKKMEAEKI